MPAPLIGLAVGAAARAVAKKAAQAGAKKVAKKATAKFVKESAGKVKLNPEPSSMKVVKTKFDMGKAAKAEKLIKDKRAAEAKATSSKKALKAANKSPKLSKDAKLTRAEAERLSVKRAKEALAANKAGKGPKLTEAQKYAFRKSL
jgi:hypothetical protein